MADSVKFGLSNVRYAFMTESEDGTVSFENATTPIPGAVSLSLSREGEETNFYADDHKYFNANQNDGYTGTLEIAQAPEDFLVKALGWTKDHTTGHILENADGVQQKFALLFEVKGNNELTGYCFYGVTASRPEEEHNTKAESIEVDTQSLDLTMVPVALTYNGATMNIVKDHMTFKTQAEVDTYLATVPMPTATVQE